MSLDNSAVVPALPTGGYQIEQSIRFEDSANSYLTKTPSTTGNRRTYTRSYWFKRGNLTGQEDYLNSITGSDADSTLFETTNEIRFSLFANAYWLRTSDVFKDTAAWYHIVEAVDTTQATSSDRWKIYVNGVQVTQFNNESYPPQNYDTKNNVSGNAQYIGMASGNNNTFDGYLAEIHWIDGQALDPTSFGETDDTYGHWKPIEYTGSYGTNGFYLDFGGTYYNDKSGNGNNFTASGLATTDVVVDSPTNNFATWNVLGNINGDTFSEGNLKVVTASSPYSWTPSSIGVSTGKVYAEFLISSSSGYDQIGIATGVSTSTSTCLGCTSETWGYTSYNGQIRHNDNSYSFGNTFTTGDLIGVAVDFDNEYIYWSKNGTWQNSGDPTSGSSGTGGFSLSSISGKTVFFGYSDFHGSGSGTYVANFGQDSSFAGNKTAQGNQDDNGIGDFYYSPPSGYLALCTDNLPDPDVIPSENFNIVTWTGNATDNRSISGVGFQPDLVWWKERSSTSAHYVSDAVRGATKQLLPSGTNSELSNTDELQAFETDGFQIGTEASINQNTETYVAWNWLANGSGSSNTNGSITSTVSANQDAGFSIVDFVSGASTNTTVGHGLSQAPELVIFKRRDTVQNWIVMAEPLLNGSGQGHLVLNETYAEAESSTITLSASASLLTIGTHNAINSNDVIAYCWHSVDGFSKVGSYTGNGSSDGTFVYTGFRPKYVMVKRTDSSHTWGIHDTERVAEDNQDFQLFEMDSNVAEDGGANYLDMVSNGFKIRAGSLYINASGGSYIYMAFAETPFKYANAR